MKTKLLKKLRKRYGWYFNNIYMSFHNKKRIIWFKNSSFTGKLVFLNTLIFLPLTFLHEYLHVIFAILFNMFNKIEIIEILKVKGNEIHTNMQCTVSYTDNKLNRFKTIIVFSSPLLIPIFLYYLLGSIGLLIAWISYNSWKLSITDKQCINDSFKILKTNL